MNCILNAVQINTPLECFVSCDQWCHWNWCWQNQKWSYIAIKLCNNTNMKKNLINYKRATRLDSFILMHLEKSDAFLKITNYIARILCQSHHSHGQATVEEEFKINSIKPTTNGFYHVGCFGFYWVGFSHANPVQNKEWAYSDEWCSFCSYFMAYLLYYLLLKLKN